MMKQPNSAPARFTVFTVCVDQETVANIVHGCEHTSGIEFAGEFHDYIGRKQRPQFSDRVQNSTASIAIIDFDLDAAQAAITAEMLHRILPGRLAIIAVSAHNDSGLLLQAMRAGCNEFLTHPIDSNEYAETVLRLQARFAAPAAELPKSSGKILSFFGAKGGVGTTTLAVYLATFLVRQHRRKTLLIDHHHQLGHVSLYLGVKENAYHFDELMRNVDRLDMELLVGFLTRHPSGLDILPSPDTCAARYGASKQEMEMVLEFLRSQYDYVLLDSSLEYQDSHSALVDCSDEVYLVSTPDVAALRDLSRHVENFGLNETAAGKLRIAINRSTSNDAVGVEQVERTVRFPVSVTIPNNYAELVRAINAGEPLSPQSRSEFTTQIGKWANRTIQSHSSADAEKPKRSRFAFWK